MSRETAILLRFTAGAAKQILSEREREREREREKHCMSFAEIVGIN